MLGDGYKDTRVIQEILYDDFGQYAKKLGGKKVINVNRTKGLAKEYFDEFVGATPQQENYSEFTVPGDAAKKSFW